MLIQIESGKKDDPRKVTVTPDEGEPFDFNAANLADAHKTLKAGHKDEWDSIRPAKAAKPVSAPKADEAKPKAAKPKK